MALGNSEKDSELKIEFVGATPLFLVVLVWHQEFTSVLRLPPNLLKNKIHPSKFGDLISFIKLFMTWVASCLATRREL